MSAPVPVTGADREAAAAYFREKAGPTLEANCMEKGRVDFWPLVQAFARHRLAALDEAAAAAFERLYPSNLEHDWTEFARDRADAAKHARDVILALKGQRS